MKETRRLGYNDGVLGEELRIGTIEDEAPKAEDLASELLATIKGIEEHIAEAKRLSAKLKNISDLIAKIKT